MKKTILALAFATSALTSHAANYVSFDVDHVKDTSTNAKSTAQYFRAGKDVANMNLGLQVRTATFKEGGMLNSVEATAGKDIIKNVNAFLGVGYDNGFNGAKNGDYTYGLAGLSTGTNIGPLWGYVGGKTRINWESDAPQQTILFVGASYPVNKTLSFNVGVSRSYQDIKERAAGLGLRVSY